MKELIVQVPIYFDEGHKLDSNIREQLRQALFNDEPITIKMLVSDKDKEKLVSCDKHLYEYNAFAKVFTCVRCKKEIL